VHHDEQSQEEACNRTRRNAPAPQALPLCHVYISVGTTQQAASFRSSLTCEYKRRRNSYYRLVARLLRVLVL
jgi:hypothetical protein